MEQKGGSIQWISERQFEQIPSCPSSKKLSQQWHCGGNTNRKIFSRVKRIHLYSGIDKEKAALSERGREGKRIVLPSSLIV